MYLKNNDHAMYFTKVSVRFSCCLFSSFLNFSSLRLFRPKDFSARPHCTIEYVTNKWGNKSRFDIDRITLGILNMVRL
jgi:hypothetical protein